MRRALAAAALLVALAARAAASQVLLNAAAANRGGGARMEHDGPDWRYYHRTDALLAAMRAAVGGCQHARAWVLKVDGGKTGGRGAIESERDGVLVVQVAEGVGARRAVDEWPGGKGDGEGKGRVRMLVALGEHGREFISAEVGLRFVERVCGVGRAVEEGLLAELRRTEFVIVPVVGVASRRLAEGGRFCERGNARGVDVNRNFGFEWGKTDGDTLPAEERPGAAAFSEAETRALHVLGMHVRPHVYVSVHSGGRALIVPWDSGGGGKVGDATVRPPVAPEVRAVAEALRDAHCADCRVGTASELLGYRAYGTGVDFMHGVVRAPIAMTWEVYGDNAAGKEECMRMFNPESESRYRETVDNWARAFETLSSAVHRLDVNGKSRVHAGGAGGIGRALFGDRWARVASRLGSAAWIDVAYNASIRVDGAGFTEHGRRQLEQVVAVGGAKHAAGGTSGDGLHVVLGEGGGLGRDSGWHPAAAMFGALLTVLSFSCMVLLLRQVVVVRRRRVVASGSGCNGGPAGRRGRQHVRNASGILQGSGAVVFAEKLV